jgi:PAS domain S-box-containing protein
MPYAASRAARSTARNDSDKNNRDKVGLTLTAMLDVSPDIVYVYDRLADRYLFVNERMSELLGYEPSQIETMADVEGIIHPADLAHAKAHYARQAQLTENDVAVTDYRLAHRNGGYRLLRCRQKLIKRNAAGAVQLILGVATDMTEQEKVRNELVALEGRIPHIREDERRRIALEMHDTVVQDLVGASILLAGVEKEIRREGVANAALIKIRSTLSRALRDVLRPLTA